MASDTLFDGQVICSQPENGYRFSIDPVLLAHFCQPHSGDKILDLGTGCGILGIILTYRYSGLRITGIELQKQLLDHARINREQNDLVDQFSLIEGDYRNIRSLLAPESFDQVVTNPPYRKEGSGRINTGDQRASARHELHGNIGNVVQAASYAVKNRGRVSCIFPANRLAELLLCMQDSNLTPSCLRPVYSYPESDSAVLVLVEAVKNGRCELELLSPLYIYTEKNGPYSEEVAAYYRSR